MPDICNVISPVPAKIRLPVPAPLSSSFKVGEPFITFPLEPVKTLTSGKSPPPVTVVPVVLWKVTLPAPSFETISPLLTTEEPLIVNVVAAT